MKKNIKNENWDDLEPYRGQKGKKCFLPHFPNSKNRLIDTHPRLSELKLNVIEELNGLMTKLVHEDDDFEIEATLYVISERAKRMEGRMRLINGKSLRND